jgi:NAD-specific glutamate dehydrogenase
MDGTKRAGGWHPAPARTWRDAGQLKLAEQVVVASARAFALIHLDEHARLIVSKGGEDLLLLGGNGGVARDEHSHDTASSLQAEAQRCDIQQQQVLHLLTTLARQDRSLQSAPLQGERHRVVVRSGALWGAGRLC